MGPQPGAVGGVVGGDAAGIVGEVQHPVRPGDRPGDVGLDPDPPHLVTRVGVERHQVGVLAAVVGRDVHRARGDGRGRHHAALQPAGGQRGLPQDLAAVAVEGAVGAGLVADPHGVGAVRREQVGHGADVGVEPAGQGDGPGVARRELAVPDLLARGEVEGDQAVAASRRREAVGLAGPDVEDAPLAVDRRRRPHRHAGALARRLIGDVEPPGLGARGGVEGDDRPAERRRVARHEHLEAADPGDDQTVGDDRRAEHDRLGVGVEVGLPHGFAGGTVERHDAGVERAHVHAVVVDGHRATDVARLEVVRPPLLTGGRVEGAHVAGPVADVHRAVGDDGRAGDALDPAELPRRGEVGNVAGADGLVGGGPRVGQVEPDPRPFVRPRAGRGVGACAGPTGAGIGVVARTGGPGGCDRAQHRDPESRPAAPPGARSHAGAAPRRRVVPLDSHGRHGSGARPTCAVACDPDGHGTRRLR